VDGLGTGGHRTDGAEGVTKLVAKLVEGKTAVVTGVGPGIGRATAVLLAEHGANLALGARTISGDSEIVSEVSTITKTIFVPTNIADADNCKALADTTAEAFGKIDILVQNAFMHGPFAGAVDTDPDDWRKVYKVNVMGTLQMIQACLPHMGEGASIVVTGSMAARTSTPSEGAYAASKAAMLSPVRTVAQEVGPRQIRANSVLPGWVHGDSLDNYFDWIATERGSTPQQVHDEIAQETALRRLVTPSDIAGAILFLASDLSRGITGIALDVNSGHWMPQ
jgi:NAD(P)-dependent dehydrogenase (short-subunit alcohol dehydrogenase family)